LEVQALRKIEDPNSSDLFIQMMRETVKQRDKKKMLSLKEITQLLNQITLPRPCD